MHSCCIITLSMQASCCLINQGALRHIGLACQSDLQESVLPPYLTCLPGEVRRDGVLSLCIPIMRAGVSHHSTARVKASLRQMRRLWLRLVMEGVHLIGGQSSKWSYPGGRDAGWGLDRCSSPCRKTIVMFTFQSTLLLMREFLCVNRKYENTDLCSWNL